MAVPPGPLFRRRGWSARPDGRQTGGAGKRGGPSDRSNRARHERQPARRHRRPGPPAPLLPDRRPGQRSQGSSLPPAERLPPARGHDADGFGEALKGKGTSLFIPALPSGGKPVTPATRRQNGAGPPPATPAAPEPSHQPSPPQQPPCSAHDATTGSDTRRLRHHRMSSFGSSAIWPLSLALGAARMPRKKTPTAPDRLRRNGNARAFRHGRSVKPGEGA